MSSIDPVITKEFREAGTYRITKYPDTIIDGQVKIGTLVEQLISANLIHTISASDQYKIGQEIIIDCTLQDFDGEIRKENHTIVFNVEGQQFEQKIVDGKCQFTIELSAAGVFFLYLVSGVDAVFDPIELLVEN